MQSPGLGIGFLGDLEEDQILAALLNLETDPRHLANTGDSGHRLKTFSESLAKPRSTR